MSRSVGVETVNPTPFVLEQMERSVPARGRLWEVAMQHSRKQVFCPDELINLFLLNVCGDLCQRENQHPSCGLDGVGEEFTT